MQPNATNRPRIAPGRNQTGTHPNLTPKQSTQNIRTAILTAIFTIELNCNKIAKPQRIARIAPESAYFRNRSGIRVRSTQNRLLPMPDRGTIDPKTTSINSIKLDCKIKKDCKAIGWIALKLHRFQVNCSNCTPTIHGIRCNPQTPTHIASPSCPQLHSTDLPTQTHNTITVQSCNPATSEGEEI